MKRITLGFSALALTTAFVLSCTPKTNVEPEADVETESAVYASWMNYVVTDIDMMCSYLAENSYDGKTFYSQYPGTSQTVTAVRDTQAIKIPVNGTLVDHDQLVMGFNTTKCLDGNVRDGSIFMYVPQQTPAPINKNVRYSRNFQWQGRIVFKSYFINGWKVDNFYGDSIPAYMYNTLASPNYSTGTTNLTWKFAGRLRFTHPSDPNKNMEWEGELHKTLSNTSDPKVFAVSKQAAIQWSLAIVKYDGKVKGTVPQINAEATPSIVANVPFSMSIDPATPLVRDFQCSPDKVSGVAFTPTGSVTQRVDEHHPFKAGVANFTIGTSAQNFYPRRVYYGNEGQPQLEAQCDNVGEVLIKGISYRVNFMK